MGYSGKLQLKQKAIALRQTGASYAEIQKKVSVSKNSLSRWCRDIILSSEQLERLSKRKLDGSSKGRIIGAKVQQKKREQVTQRLYEDGKKDVGRLSKRDRFIAGISMYIGDGLKTEREVGFSNANPQIIGFMMGWFREFCQISEAKFRGQIWIHSNQCENEAKLFWSKTTKIPPKQFNKSYIAVNKINSLKIRKQLHKYGVFAVRVYSASVQRKILGWSAGVLEGYAIKSHMFEK